MQLEVTALPEVRHVGGRSCPPSLNASAAGENVVMEITQVAGRMRPVKFSQVSIQITTGEHEVAACTKAQRRIFPRGVRRPWWRDGH